VTFNPDIDPKTWKAERAAYLRTIEYQRELIDHTKEQQVKWQKLYFEMKDKRDSCMEELEKTNLALMKALEDIDASH
jgi:hypothetical protein